MHDNQLNRKYGTILDMTNMVVSIIMGVVYTPIVLRFLGQSEYGVYTLASSVIAYLTVLDLGFGNALIRYSARFRAENKDDKDINGMFLVFSIIISIISLIIGTYLAKNISIFFETSLTGKETELLAKVYNILLYNMVLTFPLSVFSSIIRSHEKFIFFNGVALVQNILKHIVTLLFLLWGCKSIGIALISLVFTIVLICVEIYYVLVVIKVKFGFARLENVLYKEIAIYSFFILINIIVDQLYANTDKIILGKVCGSTAVAIYGIGVVFQTYFVQFSTSMSGVYFSHISQLAAKKEGVERMSKVFNQVGRLQFLVLSFILLGFLVFGKSFILLWAGNEYKESYYVALIIMIPSIVPLSQNIGISVLQALNKHKIRSIMYMCIAVVNVVISIPLALKWGSIGAALGTAIGNLLGQILFMNWYYYRRIGLDIVGYWRTIFCLSMKLIPVLIVLALVNTIIQIDGWSGLVTKIVVSIMVSSVYYYKIIFSTVERNFVERILCNFGKK